MTDPLYREIILENWQHPQNYGIVKDATFDVSDSNPLCGDEIRITGRIKNNKLEEIKFLAEGCAISKASASLFTEKVKGMTVTDIKKLTQDDVLEELGITLTPARTKCALVIYKTLQKLV